MDEITFNNNNITLKKIKNKCQNLSIFRVLSSQRNNLSRQIRLYLNMRKEYEGTCFSISEVVFELHKDFSFSSTYGVVGLLSKTRKQFYKL